MKNGPYNMIVAPAEYPGTKFHGKYAHEHKIVWWQHHGVLPEPGYEIHHLNGDHRDNRIENLKKLTKLEHRLEHGKIRTRSRQIQVTCFRCKTQFPMLRGDYRVRMKKPTARVFCSRSCGAKNQHHEARIRKAGLISQYDVVRCNPLRSDDPGSLADGRLPDGDRALGTR